MVVHQVANAQFDALKYALETLVSSVIIRQGIMGPLEVNKLIPKIDPLEQRSRVALGQRLPAKCYRKPRQLRPNREVANNLRRALSRQLAVTEIDHEVIHKVLKPH